MPWEVLSTRVLNRYVEPLIDRRTNPVPSNLIVLNRTPEVTRTEEEVIAGYTGHVFAADLIADDAKAVTKTADTITLNTSKVPNIKIGKLITQSMAALLYRIEQKAALPGEPDTFRNYIFRKYQENIQSIRIRQEVLLNAMQCGTLNYDGLGIKLQNVTFGMPSYTRITPSVLWSSTSAKPITDILNAEKAVQQKHGKTYSRVEMSAKTFDYVTATDQFKDQATLFAARAFPTNADPFANPTTTRNLFGQLVGKTLELRDESYEDQLNDGSIISRRFMPENIVKLTDPADDGNSTAREFSMVVPVEALMMNLPGVNVIGGAVGGSLPLTARPVAYASVTSDLNPPNATLWAAAKGFPSKNLKIESIALTVW